MPLSRGIIFIWRNKLVDKLGSHDIVDEALLDDIKSLLRAGDFAKAEQQLLDIVAAGSDHDEVFYMLAVCQRYLKKYSAALSNLDKLKSLVPDHSRGHQETGHVYKAMNRADAALNAYSRAIQINPALFASFRGQIDILSATGRESVTGPLKRQLESLEALPKVLVVVMDLIAHGKLVKAEELCKGFMQKVPRHIEGMRLLADIGNRLGVLEDAEFLLESAIEFSPDSTQVRIDYIHVLRKRQKYEEALAQAKLLLAKDPKNPQFQSVFAIESMQSGDYDTALETFDSILEIIPEDPVTLTSRGTALKTTGQTDEAIDSYRRAIKKYQGHGEAYYSLANLKLFSFSEEEIATMEAQEGNLGISHMSRVYLNFALGKAYEDKGLFEKSFEHYERGNAFKKAQSRYKSSELTEEFHGQVDVFDDAFVDLHKDTGHDAPDPIFIVGLPRAGSTLLEQILASHSQVDGTMELSNILSLAHKLGRGERLSMTSHYPAVLKTLDAQNFAEFGKTFIKETQIHRGSARFFIDKMPNNFRHIGLIRLMLPNAKIIDARRHPMACCFSGFKQLFAEGQEFTYGLEEVGTYYKDYVDLMDHWDKVFPGKILRVQYEDVVTDLNTQVGRILDYCGLDFEESCISFYENERSIRTPSSEQVRQPIFQSSIDQWKNFEDYLDPLKDSLGPVLDRYPI
jgi:tetratricopeptide (TPR) repeat protein